MAAISPRATRLVLNKSPNAVNSFSCRCSRWLRAGSSGYNCTQRSNRNRLWSVQRWMHKSFMEDSDVFSSGPELGCKYELVAVGDSVQLTFAQWAMQQKENLILLIIHSNSLPTIKMVTEAGLIGKIGMNSNGVGVCLNAIRTKGCDASRIPVHLGLRMVLESESAKEAVSTLESVGMAGSGHMLIGDRSGSVGLEFTTTSFAHLPMDDHGRVYHSNHLLVEHPGVSAMDWLKDSKDRVVRIRELAGRYDSDHGEPSLTDFGQLFEDQENFPCSIWRAEEGISDFATLFNIVMDLTNGHAIVRVGKPDQLDETVQLDFESENLAQAYV
jgi:hypothetical protein